MKGIPVTALLLAVVLNGTNTFAQGVYLKEIRHANVPCLLLGNEKTAIVIAKGADANTPQHLMHLAPIQSIRLPDGSFSDTDINFLEPASDYRECSAYPFYTDGYSMKEMPVKKRTLTVVKQTTAEIVLNIKYIFSKGENKGTHDVKGQPGYYTCTIMLKANEPAVMIEEETDYNFSYKFEAGRNMYNEARYRGRYSGSVEYGYMIVNGAKKQYLNEDGFPGTEAIVDLNYDVPRPSCAPYHHYEALALWNVWPANTGWYWALYNRDGAPQSTSFAIFSGRASKLIGAACVLVNMFTRSDTRAAGVRININRSNPAQYYSRIVRYQWGLYLGTKAEDVVPPAQASALLKWFNRKSGLAEKIDQYERAAPAPAAEFEWAAFYQDKDAVQQMIQRSRKDQTTGKMLAARDVDYAGVFDAWTGNTCSAEKIYNTIKVHYESFKELMINGQGIYALTLTKKGTGPCSDKEILTDFSHYIRAADWFKRDVLQAGALLAAEKAGAITLRRAQRDSMKMFAGVYARVLWDDDFAPITLNPKTNEDAVNVDHGIGYGAENMFVGYRADRDFFALLFRNDTYFKPLYEGIVARCRAAIKDVINEAGASTASPHYTAPTMEGLVMLMLQLKQQGNNFFETEPRVQAFGRFYLNLLTPPSVRFANNRKVISFGDGSEESTALFGLLSTGFRSSNPKLNQLADDLDEAYRNGPMRALPKTGMVSLVYDYSRISGSKPISSLASNSYPGYLLNFRYKVNTPAESAIWMLNGNHYYDHRNDDDGEMAIYALRTPISLSRSSLYDPYANAATVRSMVLPFKDFPLWSGNAQPISYGNQHKRTWIQSGLNRFADFAYNGFSSITMGKDDNKWKRDLLFYHGNENYPIIIIKDELTSREPHIWSMPFFSDGSIVLPDRNTVNTGPADNCVTKLTLPNAAMVNGRTEWSLLNDWNRFSFTGQEWRNYDPAKNVNGTDWWLFTYNQNNDVKASFTEWTNFYIPGPEMQEFEKTHPYKFPKNCVEKDPSIHYREKQQIIRFKGRDRFMNIIMPFRKGEAPPNCSVKQTGTNRFIITRTVNGVAETIEVSNEAIVYQSAQKTVITTLGSNAGNSGSTGVSVSGGIAELVWEGNKIQITVPLNSGNRSITLPSGGWKNATPPANVSVALSGNRLTVVTGADKGNISSTPGSMVTVLLTR